MFELSIYDPASGVILRRLITDAANAPGNIGPGERAVYGDFDDGRFVIAEDGAQVLAVPRDADGTLDPAAAELCRVFDPAAVAPD